MKCNIKNWGTPHGVAGNISATDKETAFKEASKLLFYRMGISVKGGYFELFKEKHHTATDVENAKKWLKLNQDVVAIKIVQEVCNN